MFAGLAAFAQTGKVKSADADLTHFKAVKNTHSSTVVGKAPAAGVSSRAVIWSDDFSVPANWIINSPLGNSTIDAVWQIGTTGPVGAYKIPNINSTTAANGFALFDSDQNCSFNQIADITTASPINLSASPFVNLNFQQQYRRYYDSTFVFVSNDGSTWVKFPVNVPLNNNDSPPAGNPDYVKIDISAVAGGQANVYIRFEFFSPNTLGASAGCGYSWMIDDVSITDMAANDIVVDRAYVDFGYVDGGYYTQTPTSQVQPLSFRAAVSNQGSAAQTLTGLNVKISDGASIVYDQNSPPAASIAYKGLDTLTIATPAFTPPAMPKNYTAVFKVKQVETELAADTMNNFALMPFAVSDTVYARDNGTVSSATSANYYTGGDVDDARIGVIYEFTAAATATSISAYLDQTTAVGTSAQAKIYEIAAAGLYNEIAASAVVSINAAPTGWVNFQLPPTALVAGSTYIACIVSTGVVTGPPNSYVVIGADKVTMQPVGTTLVYLPAYTTPGWYSIGAAVPMIRLNVASQFVGIAEQKNNGLMVSQNMPNPFSASTVINYQLEKSASVSLSIFDVTGKKVAEQSQGTQTAGSHSISVNAGSLNAGVYYYSLKAGANAGAAMKMVIIK